MIRSRAPGINNKGTDELRDMVTLLPKDDFKKNAWHPAWMQMLLACIASCFLLVLGYAIGHSSAAPHQENAIIDTASNDPCSDEPMRNQGVPTFKLREDLGSILERENMSVGVELGVQRGYFSNAILKLWPSCREYHLVDLWAPQENYKDPANVDQATQNRFYDETMENTKEWKDKIRVCRNLTSVCVENMPDGYFDFIYVDARHDFKGVYDDLRAWWPKLRVGGIMAGHDYVTQDDGPEQSGQDWTTNYDGTKDETGTVIKGAVDKFSTEVCRQLTVSYRESAYNSWAMRK